MMMSRLDGRFCRLRHVRVFKAMALYRMTAMAFCMFFGATVHGADPTVSLCTSDETILFSCAIESKIMSVCGTKDLSKHGAI